MQFTKLLNAYHLNHNSGWYFFPTPLEPSIFFTIEFEIYFLLNNPHIIPLDSKH